MQKGQRPLKLLGCRAATGLASGSLLAAIAWAFSAWAPSFGESLWPFNEPFLKYWLLCSTITGLLGYRHFGVIVGPAVATSVMTLVMSSTFFSFLFLLYCICGSLFVAYCCWLMFERNDAETQAGAR